MNLEIVRRIRGNIHGTIDISTVENAVIDHPYVQRLRRIKQTAFLQYVFPCASHSRFEHSLGVMHLAGVCWKRLQMNQERLFHTLKKYPHYAEIEAKPQKGNVVHGLLSPTFGITEQLFESPYNLQCLKLAALLHDLGHPPFSHSGERFLPSWDKFVESVEKDPMQPDYLKEYFSCKRIEFKNKDIDTSTKKVRHEAYTLLMVYKVLMDTYQNYSNLSLQISPRDVISVLAPEIEPEVSSPVKFFKTHKLLHELISGELDIDRMDYLLRDSREAGVVYGIFDAGRILDSLAIYYDPATDAFHPAIHFSGLAAFEDYLRARHSMYLQVYFHKTGVACEAMFQNLVRQLGGWTLPENLEEYAEIDEYNIAQKLEEASQNILKRKKKETDNFSKTMKDLIYYRRLWKRVYEKSSNLHSNPDELKAHMAKAKEVLSELEVEYEEISSENALTRFQPREKNKPSQNNFKLIKKDDFQFPRVQPLEDYSQLIAANINVQISRIYIPNNPVTVDLVKKKLIENFSNLISYL